MSSSIKRAVAESLLERGSLFIHLDPRLPGVSMPAWLRRQPQVVLQVGLNMPIPIPDLAVDDDGVHATLSFNRTPHYCSMPWDAVFALVGDDGRGQVFPESMPVEIRREVDREAAQAGLLEEQDEDDADGASDEDDATEGAGGAERGRGREGDAAASGTGADVIPLWPRSIGGTGGKATRASATPRQTPRGDATPKPPTPIRAPVPRERPDADEGKGDDRDPPDGPKPRSPHPHLRRIK